MYFAGEYSKFEVGDKCLWKVPEEEASFLFRPCEVIDIGILGSKLGEHHFLYTIKTVDDNKTHQTLENNLYIL